MQEPIIFERKKTITDGEAINAFVQAQGNLSETARLLGISRAGARYWRDKLVKAGWIKYEEEESNATGRG